MPPEITRLVDTFLHNPVRVEVSRAATTAENITQTLVPSGGGPEQKRSTLRRLIRDAENFKNAIIFCNRKRDVQVVYRSLEKHGFSVAALHGDLDQRMRMAALDSFRNDQVQLLVCSDVAARGLDIPDVSHVINYDAPHHSEDYVHRIGRTGRAGKTGVALTIVTRSDQKSIAEIEKLIARKIEWQNGAEFPSEDEDGTAAHESRTGRGGRQRSQDRAARPERHAARGEQRARPERPAASRVEDRAKPDRHPERAAESRRHHAERPAQERVAAQQEREAPAPRAARFGDPSPRKTERPRGDDERVVGLGDHVPSFLLRPVPKRLRPTHEHVEAEE
jgi:superfamily II DNA/RNA helicase